jgi:hypothetical protein
MPWDEVIGELESKLVGTLKGTFTPMDGVPFFPCDVSAEGGKGST